MAEVLKLMCNRSSPSNIASGRGSHGDNRCSYCNYGSSDRYNNCLEYSECLNGRLIATVVLAVVKVVVVTIAAVA